MNNQELHDKALKAIEELFNDVSVSKELARLNLVSLIDEINIMIDSLGENDEIQG